MIVDLQLFGGRGSGGSRNSGSSEPQKNLTRTERFVNLIADDIIGGWVEDSGMDEDEIESIQNWHDLMEHLDMTSAEAQEAIVDDLFDRAGTWRWYETRNIPEEDKKLIFMDNEFEDEKGNFIKYGEVMKLVKQRLAAKGIMRKGN